VMRQSIGFEERMKIQNNFFIMSAKETIKPVERKKSEYSLSNKVNEHGSIDFRQ